MIEDKWKTSAANFSKVNNHVMGLDVEFVSWDQECYDRFKSLMESSFDGAVDSTVGFVEEQLKVLKGCKNPVNTHAALLGNLFFLLFYFSPDSKHIRRVELNSKNIKKKITRMVRQGLPHVMLEGTFYCLDAFWSPNAAFDNVAFEEEVMTQLRNLQTDDAVKKGEPKGAEVSILLFESIQLS